MSLQVVDWDKSERGPQRRKTAQGRLLHCCCICGRIDTWGDGWSTYCSEGDIDDGVPVPKFCSEDCRSKGGRGASNVTPAMKQAAKDSERREPALAYRDATEREKYNHARRLQDRSGPWVTLAIISTI